MPLASFLVCLAHRLEAVSCQVVWERLNLVGIFAKLLYASLFTCRHARVGRKDPVSASAPVAALMQVIWMDSIFLFCEFVSLPW